MPGDSWRTIEHLFEQAIQITARARGQWLDNACDSNPEIRREVASLLESDEASAGGFVNTKVERAIVSFGQNSEQPPAQVGVYRLVREIGRGGMGSVYLAERDDDQYRKKVAVKLVRRGMDTDFILMRFRRERQILASLEHPNIGRMLDGGTTPDGLPYLVMEYVNGNSIIEYCQMRNLSIDQKLHLFLEVCAGVEYAHQNFVVHRDLKPGNILVDETGTPKLLDFGISKLLYNDVADASAPSIDESRIMTPDYASPEQIQGDPTTAASDIYSLGAILYELLTGKRPHRIEGHSPQAVELAICFDELIPPSSAATDKRTCRRLSGDLDSIVLRAMQKAQRDRYATTAQFADDIRNHLAHRPVLAHPTTTVYRVLKYTRRNRVPVAAAALVVIALTTGVVLSRNSAQTATRHFQSLRKLARVFVFDVHDAVRDLPGSTPARQIIVRTGLEYLDNLSKDSGGDPDLESEVAAAYQKIGEIQHANLGNERAALESFQKTIRLLDSIARKRPSDTRTYRARINVLADIG
ncbi:MAG: serine/threonine protein kinase, partial [Bryobacteraceae bacterium]|nr:serine/threonine protein kinase [Bryobacteraceae bacterium]